jgi:protein-S-isoprenylcysteine O-methyltransferase Ste14
MARIPETSQPIADARIFPIRFRMPITLLAPVILLLTAWMWGPRMPAVPWLVAGGTLCAVSGMLLRLWAAGYLRKDQVLIREGPFAFTRNPLYLGTFLIGCGFALLTGWWVSLVLVTLVMAFVYLPTIRQEELQLRALFAEDYRAYCRDVPRWFPRLTARRRSSPANFQFHWAVVRSNREHLHLISQVVFLLAFYAVYWVKQS